MTPSLKTLALAAAFTTGAAFTIPTAAAPLSSTRSQAPTLLNMAGGGDVPMVKPPPALLENAITLGAAKASLPFTKVLLLGILSGIHIGFGAFLALSIGGMCPGIMAANPGLQKIIFGAFGLPFGLLMTIVGGGELFTGNTALCTAAYLDGKAEAGGVLRNWVASYAGNFIGSLLLVKLVIAAGLNPASSMGAAVAKTGMTAGTAISKGILCNWLVCMAVWMSTGCVDLVSKAVAIWFPISAFVALGTEHSIANMFMIPLGISKGADVSFGTFLTKNLLPVTIGNAIAGIFCVAGMYSLVYGSMSRFKDN